MLDKLHSNMTRIQQRNVYYELGGNQRDTDRLRAEARHAKKGVGERKEGNPIARNERYGDVNRN